MEKPFVVSLHGISLRALRSSRLVSCRTGAPRARDVKTQREKRSFMRSMAGDLIRNRIGVFDMKDRISSLIGLR